ncbi:uncharacterized protein METZ01_LOCUS228913 [marine metagenome]|uniref:Uncharacterized protein n=1 Tax=marine metagenome TaxID=408172 RepID=A0A382GM67_9ZZZZ|tara:strand:+ start:4430 stop:5041 length:612 start_codon:yes stop_codon:yes gene_type:complete
MTQKAEDLKRFISNQFDVYKKRLEIIEKKHFRDNCYEEMKEISDIGDISTLLDLLKELHSLDAKLFYDLCSKNNTELEDLIFDHGKLNGLDEIYISIKAKKQKIIIKQQKYKKLALFYKIKKMKVIQKYQEDIRTIEEEYKIAQLNLTLSCRSKNSKENIQFINNSDESFLPSDLSSVNFPIDNIEKNSEINNQWEILDIEEI